MVSQWIRAYEMLKELASNVTGYSFVYHCEIYMLFASLIAIGPLVRSAHHSSTPSSTKFGLAEFPG